MTEISQAARAFRQRVEDPARFLETCDGGDPGSPDRRAIWVLGIEPGWSLGDEAADQRGERDQLLEDYPIELQLTWPYNRQAFKLLAALAGQSPDDYREFAEQARPFERGSTGYFKGNLFPVPFNNVGTWDGPASESTGFESKDEYRDWMHQARFAVLAQWIAQCQPRLVIGTGLTHLADFLALTQSKEEPTESRFEVNGHTKRLFVSTSGTVPLAVVPHLSGGSYSLNSNEAIRITADIIRAAISL